MSWPNPSLLTLGARWQGLVMSRKLRIEYPGAMYHVMNRGDQREDIFRDDEDRQRFLATLGEACGKTEWQAHAYCLMRNHFHVVRGVDTGELAGAQQAGDGAGVALIGLERRAGLFGDQRWGGDQAGQLELLEAAGDAEAAVPSLVSDFQLGAGVGFADAAQGDFQAAQIVGDGAVEPNLALGAGLSGGEGMESLWTSSPR